EVKRLVARLSEQEREEALGQWFDQIELHSLTVDAIRESESITRYREPPPRKRGKGGSKSTKRSKPKLVGTVWPGDLNAEGGEDIFLRDDRDDSAEVSPGGVSIFGPVDVEGNPIKNDRSVAASSIRVPKGGVAEEDKSRSFEEAQPESEEEVARDIVNLGFAHTDAADQTLESVDPLQTGHSYYFWLNIGRAHENAIGTPTRIDLEKLPQEAVLTVAIFGFDKELSISANEDV